MCAKTFQVLAITSIHSTKLPPSLTTVIMLKERITKHSNTISVLKSIFGHTYVQSSRNETLRLYNITASVTITIQPIDKWHFLQLCPPKIFLIATGAFWLQEQALWSESLHFPQVVSFSWKDRVETVITFKHMLLENKAKWLRITFSSALP